MADLRDVPLSLIQRCGLVIQSWHRKHSLDFEKILWHRETMVLITMVDETQALLTSWRKAWRRKTKDENMIAICAAIMALEILVSNFMEWGTRYPLGHAKAEKLLAHHTPDDKTRLMNIFKITETHEDQDFARLVHRAFDPDIDYGLGE